MHADKKIKSALISVYHKDGLDSIVLKLKELGITFYSTGGTQTFLESLGCKVTAVESLTTYPSILGGRGKTLHPTVASGSAEQDIKEKIDIGGISLIRAAAKNFNDVIIVASKQQYGKLDP